MLTAKEIMTINPVTVPPEMKVRQLAELLAEKNFNGAPVVNEKKELIGVVTISDLIYQQKTLHLPTVFTLFDSIIPLKGTHEIEEQIQKMLGGTVGEIMTSDPITISEDTTLSEIATIMSEQNKHLLPVMRNEDLAGVVDRSDVMRAIVAG